MPLHSKKSKRCPVCRHILIKPEQKAQSVRYKIKLVAANYIPAIVATLPADPARRAPDAPAQQVTLHANRTYPFQLSLTNPLYDPVQVRLQVQRQAPPSSAAEGEVRRPPFAISLPSTAFPIAAFAEAWEYEDDEDMLDDDEFGLGGREKDASGRKNKTVGVLERRANVTVVGGEALIGKDARGDLKVRFPTSAASQPIIISTDRPLQEQLIQVQDRTASRSTTIKGIVQGGRADPVSTTC